VLHISRLLSYNINDIKFPNQDKPVPAHQPDVNDIPPNFCEVEDIIKSRKHKHNGCYRTEYFINWIDFPVDVNSWEPLSNSWEPLRKTSAHSRQEMRIICAGAVSP
jgi:Chromo (CHRromatin Organisation MOdifier) domain